MALSLLLTRYPGLSILIPQWVEHKVGSSFYLLATVPKSELLAVTLNRLTTVRRALANEDTQENRPPVLRSVPGPIGASIRAVATADLLEPPVQLLH